MNIEANGATRQIRQFEREHAHVRAPVVAYTSSAFRADQSPAA